MLEWFDGLQGPAQGAIIALAGNFVIFVLGFLTIALNSANARKQSLVAESQKRRLALYDRVCDDSTAIYLSLTDALAYATNFKVHSEWAFDMQSAGLPFSAPDTSMAEMNRLQLSLLKEVGRITEFGDMWQVLHPQMSMFGIAAAQKQQALADTFKAFYPSVAWWVPLGQSGQQSAAWQVPSKEQLNKISASISDYERAGMDVLVLVHDFRVEMQALLVSDFFDGRVVRRTPPDPQEIVYRLDHGERVRAQLAKSKYGQKQATAETDAWNRHGRKPPQQ